MPGTFTPSMTVTLHDNGSATFTYSNGMTLQHLVTYTATGWWDDATPWPTGAYDLQYFVKTSSQKDSFRILDVSGRTGILIHNGLGPQASEGCLIVAQTFIDNVYNDMELHSESTVSNADSSIAFNVTGNFDVQLQLSAAATSVTEGANIELTVSLVGPGATGGVSEDIYVKIVGGVGTATNGVDYTNPTVLAQTVSITGEGSGWIRIPRGQSSITVTIPTLSDSFDTGSESPFETATFRIDDYLVRNDFNSMADTFYTDEARILTRASGDVSETIRINNRAPLIDKTITASGGNEGYHNANEQFSPGQVIHINFVPFSIPDRLTLSSSSGAILLDTGFIGNGFIFNQNFTIPANGDGQITIDILTNNPGTAWTFTISSVNSNQNMPGMTEGADKALDAWRALQGSGADGPLSAASTGPLAAFASSQVQAEAVEDGASAGFTLQINDVALRGKTIDWVVTFDGLNPASAADFPPGAVLAGSILIPADAALGSDLAYRELAQPLADGLAEGIQGYQVVFRDALTSQPILDEGGQPVVLDYSIVDVFTVTPAQVGGATGDTLTGSDESDVLIGDLGDDVLTGLGASDFIDGGAGADQINGGSGDDTLVGGFGNDAIDGGEGFDTLIVSRAAAEVEIVYNSDGSVSLIDKSAISLGTDRLSNVESVQFSDGVVALQPGGPSVIRLTNNADTVSYTSRAAGVNVLGLAGADFITGSRFADRLNGGDGDDKLVGLDGDDLLFGLGGADTLQGLNGDDQLNGGEGNDKLFGGLGKDTLTGAEGDDNLQGADGDDVLKGGDGIDTLSGGAGVDRLYGEAGDDKLDGGLDDDLMSGGAGKDKLYGGAGADRLYGEADDDTILAGVGADFVDGGDGKDFVLGEDGDDTLLGKAGDDILNGGAGADRLVGGEGVDILIGGAGNDVFVFDSYSANPTFPFPRDTIKDFVQGDRIDLSAIDVDPGTQANEAFTFMGTSQFNGAGQVRYVVSGNNTIVYVNVGGDYAAELEFTLTGYNAGLSAADFFL